MRRYYIQPLDQDTNNALARAAELDPDEPLPVYMAEHGKSVHAGECSKEVMDIFMMSRSQAQLSFNLWTSYNGGKLRKLSTSSRARLVSEVQKMVKGMLKRPLKYGPQLVR